MKRVGCLLLSVLFCLATGCALFGDRADASKDEEKLAADADKLKVEEGVLTIGDVARVLDLHSVKVEGVGLVVNLDGTGSDPALSAWRNLLMEDMKKRDVKSPNAVLASPDTSLVLVRGYLRPGIRKGDHFDVDVFLPDGSATTSLKGGWLMETRLSEGASVNGLPLTGHTYAKVSGPVMVPSTDETLADDPLLRRGRVLGSAVSLNDRSLSLIMLKKHQTGPEVIRVGDRINSRFSAFGRGARMKEGLATPKTNKYVDLKVSLSYKHNLPRYLDVIQNLALDQDPSQKSQRLDRLGEMLRHPTTARQAALRLEGIGPDGKRVLQDALEDPNPEVRFFAAEALAYLGEPACAKTLQQAARDEPALRIWALTALASLDEAISREMLVELMNGTSAETRYGAFRALWALDDRDPFIRGEHVGDQIYLYDLDTQGTPMIHVTRSFRPEVVLFGRDQQLDTPLMLDVGRHILVTASSESDKLKLSRFAIGEEDQVAECSRKVADVVRTAVKLGATYPDIVSMLQQAADRQNLQARVEVDALPEGGRVLARDRREIPDDRPGLFPTEFVSETAPHDAQADRDDSPDGDADTTTEIGPASDENFDATAPDFDTLLGGPGS